MKFKNADDITDIFFNKTITDMPRPSSNFQPSEYLFFVKDTSYEGDLDNKMTLIIVDANDGYVVNNNFKFNSIEIDQQKIIIYYMVNNKRNMCNYWFK